MIGRARPAYRQVVGPAPSSPVDSAHPVLRVDDLRKSFGSVEALRGVDFEVHTGEIVAILGPSGCGKTTLLRLIAGLERPTGGRVLLDGADVTGVRVQDRRVGIMFQSYALFPHLTVSQNVKFGLEATKIGAEAQRTQYVAAMQLLQLDPDAYGDRLPRELSGGQQQRVALARALVIEPRILLLDEPFSNLDAKVRESMRLELLSRLKDAGVTVLVVTHDQMDAAYMSDRVVVLDDGRVTQVAPYADLYAAPASAFVGDFIGESNWIDGCRLRALDADGPWAHVDVPGVGTWQVGDAGGAGSAVGAGSDCRLLIRREAISALEVTTGSPAPPEDSCTFTGKVENVVDLGLNVVVWLAVVPGRAPLPFNVRRAALEVRPTDLVGRSVIARLNPDMCAVFPADQEAR